MSGINQLRLLTLPQLRERGISYSRQHLARLEAAEKFPKRVKVGDGGRVAWLEFQIDHWMLERVKASGINLQLDTQIPF